MAAFDWRKFCEAHQIDYIERGASTAKGNIYIACPMCGNADAGHHMGLHLDSGAWGCWKNNQHRGRAPNRLIQACLGISWADAARIAGKGAGGANFGSGGLLSAVRGMLGLGEPEAPKKPLRLPREFKPLTPHANGASKLFTAWMADVRRYGRKDLDIASVRFNLHWSMTGDWSYRLIVPIHDEKGDLITWTGRAITDQANIRYKTLTSDPEKAGEGPMALQPISDCLLGLSDLFEGGSFLVLGEGPFDGFRLSLMADEFDARGSCLFGKVVSDAQLDLLAQLRPRYDAIFLLLDPDAALDALRTGSQLRALGVIPIPLHGDDDPDEMPRHVLRGLFEDMARKAEQVNLR